MSLWTSAFQTDSQKLRRQRSSYIGFSYLDCGKSEKKCPPPVLAVEFAVLPDTRLSKAGSLSRSETHCRSEQTSTPVFFWRNPHRSPEKKKTHFSSPNTATSSSPAGAGGPRSQTRRHPSPAAPGHMTGLNIWPAWRFSPNALTFCRSELGDTYYTLTAGPDHILTREGRYTNIDSVPVWVRQNTY